MQTLITGGSGVLGTELRRIFPDALAPSHSELDIAHANAVRNYFIENKVATVIHTAATVNIRKCETEKHAAWRTNVEGTHNLLLELRTGYFVYISTACVFSGDDPAKFYSENDAPFPKHFYGITKLQSEHIVESYMLANEVKRLIVRTNFVYRGKWKYPKAFTDRYSNYLYADVVAKAIKELVEKQMTGIVHIHGDRVFSMYELAKLLSPQVAPMTLNEYVGPPLTKNMKLSSVRIPSYRFE